MNLAIGGKSSGAIGCHDSDRSPRRRARSACPNHKSLWRARLNSPYLGGPPPVCTLLSRAREHSRDSRLDGHPLGLTLRHPQRTEGRCPPSLRSSPTGSPHEVDSQPRRAGLFATRVRDMPARLRAIETHARFLRLPTFLAGLSCCRNPALPRHAHADRTTPRLAPFRFRWRRDGDF